jgi:hypothetical protein
MSLFAAFKRAAAKPRLENDSPNPPSAIPMRRFKAALSTVAPLS